MTEPALERCTRILLPEILDHLGLWDILCAMRVNRLWRAHATNHPTYYGDLWLLQLDPPEYVDSFLLRLSRSAGRPISVHVDLLEQTPLRVIQEIGSHLPHITSLTVNISTRHSASAVMEHLCRPAHILRNLTLRHGGIYERRANPLRPWTLPADFLAQHAPALDYVELQGFDISSGIPDYFSTITALHFYGLGWDPAAALVVPSPFERCPKLRELHLAGNVTLHPEACQAVHRDAWDRMTGVMFTGSEIASRWPAFRLPLDQVQSVSVSHGDATSALALADTLPGPLYAAFPPPRRRPPVPLDPEPSAHYTASLRSATHSHSHSYSNVSRVLEGTLAEHECISVFSIPSLADRVVVLDLALDAWDDFVGLRTFGPFRALDELVLTITDGTRFERSTASAWPKLSCLRLQRLVLRGTLPSAATTADVAAAAAFALACLFDARFPLGLESDGITLTGAWNDVRGTFSRSTYRGAN